MLNGVDQLIIQNKMDSTTGFTIHSIVVLLMCLCMKLRLGTKGSKYQLSLIGLAPKLELCSTYLLTQLTPFFSYSTNHPALLLYI